VTVGDISGLHNGGIAANLTTTGSGDLDFTAGNIAAASVKPSSRLSAAMR
jgi:hypothetical protein